MRLLHVLPESLSARKAWFINQHMAQIPPLSTHPNLSQQQHPFSILNDATASTGGAGYWSRAFSNE